MSKPELVAMIRNEIKQNGPIPFAHFMEWALYHPEYGYYLSPGEKIGLKGDYYTSSSVHPIFGHLIAKQLIQLITTLRDFGKEITLVEMGAGKGSLCHDILHFIQKADPSLFKSLQYIIVEKSTRFATQQKERLQPLFPDQVRWEKHLPSGLTGVILSNELVDAFSVHRLVVHQGSLQEVHVDVEKDHFVERLLPLSTPALSDYLQKLGVEISKMVRIEVNLAALDWMREVGQALDQGYVLTIDYGYPADQLYTQSRPQGTFLCYYGHTAHDNPYLHIGEQDMTAHVDFTSLEQTGREVHLMPIGFTDQAHFLIGLGITNEMERLAKRMEESDEMHRQFLAMKELISSMGKTYKVFLQGKNVSPPPLDGFQWSRERP